MLSKKTSLYGRKVRLAALMEGFVGLFSNVKSIALVVLFFGGSIFFHELGHFLAAKKFKLFVPRFSIGFGPKLFSFNHNGTEFRISLLPLGGYVALPQLMEAKELEGSFDIPGNTPSITPKIRIIVASMGAIFNLIFALLLAIVLGIVGIHRPQAFNNNIIGYIPSELILESGKKVPSPAKQSNLKIGDRILAVDGHQTSNFSEIKHNIALGKQRTTNFQPLSTLTVQRGQEIFDIDTQPVLIEQNSVSKESFRVVGFEPYQQLKISKIQTHSPAFLAGLQAGDRIHSINGIEVMSYSHFIELLDSENYLKMDILRGDKMFSFHLSPRNIPITKPAVKLKNSSEELLIFPQFKQIQSSEANLKEIDSNFLVYLDYSQKSPFCLHSINGHRFINFNQLTKTFAQLPQELSIDFTEKETSETIRNYRLKIDKVEILEPTYQNSIGVSVEGIVDTVYENPLTLLWKNIQTTFSTLGSLIHPKSDVHFKNLMGPPGILKTLNSFASIDFRLLMLFVVMINVNLAIFNLLPIPILDGGIIFFSLVEAISKRKIPQNVMASLQSIFVLVFLGMVLYISIFDVKRIIGDRRSEVSFLRHKNLNIDSSLFWERP